MKRSLLFIPVFLLAALFMVSCGANDSKEKEAAMETPATEEVKMEAPKNVVETAMASPDHSTLVAAVKAAGLVETLSGTGPFTVFAPTNAAFAALPAGTLDNLLKPENKADLTAILTYHVVPGKVMSSQLTDGQKVKTVNGAELTVSIKDGKVMIDGAHVTAADVDCSNGVIHVIDAVVLPKK
ncbi:MAG TPA: fasciclin domain-containing protein [Chitinophagaceae bacterium]|nr:fasciclin domain-containing protein [Chitinophagaceae bacterium]